MRIIKTYKFKNNAISFNFFAPYNKEQYFKLLCLNKFFGEESLTYNSKNKMTLYKDYLYGADINCLIQANEKFMIFNITYYFVNEKFLDDINENDYLNFIKETFENLLLKEERLNEYKRRIISNIKRYLDNPGKLGFNNAIKYFSNFYKPLEIYVIDKCKEIENINIEDIKDAYKYLLNDMQLDIYLVGDINDKICSIIQKYENNNYIFNIDKNIIEDLNINDYAEETNFKQSQLFVFYNTHINYYHHDCFSLMLFNYYLGTSTTSLLFENVREKLGLCYEISSHLFKTNGLLYISTIIDNDTKDKVINEINMQIEYLKESNDIDKFNNMKNLLIEELKSIEDDLLAYIQFLYSLNIYGINDIDELIYKLSLVELKDINKIAKNITYIFSYMFKGQENGNN